VLVTVHAGRERVSLEEACGTYRPPEVDRALVLPGQTVKVSVPTPWFSSAWVHVHASGVGIATRRIEVFRVQPLILPHDFEHGSAMLAYVGGDLIKDVLAPRDRYRMTVSIDGKVCRTIDDYRGEFVWVGAPEAVSVPDPIKTQVRAEYLLAGVDVGRLVVLDLKHSVHPWTTPLPGPPVTLVLERVATNPDRYEREAQTASRIPEPSPSVSGGSGRLVRLVAVRRK
jgi:hypothetical protein